MDSKIILGMDIGGTHIRTGLVDSEGNLTAFEKAERRDVLSTAYPVERLLEYIGSYIKRQPGIEISAISVGVPSTVDLSKRRIISSPNIENFDDVPLAELLEQRFGFPAFLDRDVNMLFRQDRAVYSLPENGIGIGCYIGTGIGNVIVIDGELLSGKNGVACELGHVPVMGRSELCPCGNEGCYENYASGRYLNSLSHRNGDVSVRELFTDSRYSGLIREFVDSISVVIATEVNILDPHYIILGGGVLLSGGFPLELLEERVRAHSRSPYPRNGLKFYYSKDADRGGVKGAALYARKKLKEMNR